MEDSRPISCRWLLLCTALVGCAPPANVAFASSDGHGPPRGHGPRIRDCRNTGRQPGEKQARAAQSGKFVKKLFGVMTPMLKSCNFRRDPSLLCFVRPSTDQASRSVVYTAATSASRYQTPSFRTVQSKRTGHACVVARTVLAARRVRLGCAVPQPPARSLRTALPCGSV